MAAIVRCPACFARVPFGRLCEQCGAPLPQDVPIPTQGDGGAGAATVRHEHGVDMGVMATVRSEQPLGRMAVPPSPEWPEPQAPFTTPPPMPPAYPASAEPTLEFDALCLQFADMTGFLRVRFNPGEGTDGCDNVTLALKDQATGLRQNICEGAWYNRVREFRITIPPHAAGPVVFDVSLSYEKNGKRVKLGGDWATVSVGKGDERRAAENLVVNITTNITGGHASEIHNSTQACDKIKEALRGGADLTDQLREIVSGSSRAYVRIDLFGDGQSALPAQPAEARTDRLMLDLGTRRLLLLSGRTVTFGRDAQSCDVFWRHPYAEQMDRNDPANNDYRKISRRQCLFEHRGDKVALIDGGRDASGRMTPSTGGTYFNAVRVEGEKILSTDGTGSGLLTFSDSAATGMLSVCLPGDVCAKCTRAERTWCQGGRRPSLVLKRLDGVPESAVMVWSCFRLEEVDPSFEGVKIFRADGGFAWRRGRRCGWLVPGVMIETDCGTVRVNRLLSPSEVEGKIKMSETSR